MLKVIKQLVILGYASLGMLNVFIVGYVTFSSGCYMVCSSVASLSCSHLYSFASYDRPYALKIKYPVTRGFLLDVVFCMLLYERFSTFCTFTKSLLYEHSLDHFVGLFSCCNFLHSRVFIVCCIISSHSVDEGIIKRVAHGSC